jgi:hypothetical protein
MKTVNLIMALVAIVIGFLMLAEVVQPLQPKTMSFLLAGYIAGKFLDKA